MSSPASEVKTSEHLGRGVHLLDQTAGRLSKSLAVLSAVGVIGILVTMVLNVGLRASGSGSIHGSYELIETGVVAVTFLGLPLAERTRANVRIDLVTNRMNRAWAGRSRKVAGTLALVVTLLLAVASWQAFDHSLTTNEVRQGIVTFPLWPARLAVAVGFSALSLELLCTLFKRLARGYDSTAGAESET